MLGQTGQSSDAARADRRKADRRKDDRQRVRHRSELEAVRCIVEALSEHRHSEDLVEQTLTTALRVVDAEAGSILLANKASRELVFQHVSGAGEVLRGKAIPWDKGIAGAVFQTGKPVIVQDVARDPRHLGEIREITHYSVRDMITLPLKRWEGEPVGVLQVLNKREGVLSEDDLGVLSIISAIAAVIIEHAQLQQEIKLAEVARLLGGIGHDVKNLLTPTVTGHGLLRTAVEDLYKRLPSEDQEAMQPDYRMCNEIFGMVDGSMRRIQERVKEIADCVKGLTSPPKFEPCDVSAVINDVFQVLRWQAEQAGVTLKNECAEGLPQIIADDRRLFNALYNLTNNAIPEIGKGGWVTISAKQHDSGEGLLLTVADNGRGMPPEMCEELLTGNAQSRKSVGSGLGMKIVKDVIDAHHGTISVESELGVGTIFYIVLPLNPAAA